MSYAVGYIKHLLWERYYIRTINFWECEGHMVRRIEHYLSLDLLWLVQLMPSHKRNSIMAKAPGLISSHFNAASSQDVPFHQP